ncbi:hypothetical protein [Neisseria sp.]
MQRKSLSIVGTVRRYAVTVRNGRYRRTVAKLRQSEKHTVRTVTPASAD